MTATSLQDCLGGEGVLQKPKREWPDTAPFPVS
jgi:hypothetical protein